MIIPSIEPNHSAGEKIEDSMNGPIINRIRKKIERESVKVVELFKT